MPTSRRCRLHDHTRVHASRECRDGVRATQVPGADPRIYEEVADMSQLQPTIEEYLNDYNAESKQPMPRVTVSI